MHVCRNTKLLQPQLVSLGSCAALAKATAVPENIPPTATRTGYSSSGTGSRSNARVFRLGPSNLRRPLVCSE